MYVTGLLVFVLGSALAALSPVRAAHRGPGGAGRGRRAAGAAHPDPDQRGVPGRAAWHGHRHLGRLTGLGVEDEPVVGGAVGQGASWQWIFWLNVPVGLVTAALAARRLTESRGPRPQLDIVGLLLAGPACSR